MHVTTMRPESVERRRWWILGVLAFSVLVIVLDNSVLNVALPAIVRQLDASNSGLQWMVDAYSLAFAGLLLTMGSLGDTGADRHSRSGSSCSDSDPRSRRSSAHPSS